MLQVRISRKSVGTAYQINHKTHQLSFEKGKRYTKLYRIGRFVHYNYASFMFGSFIHMFLTAENEGITIDQVLSVGWICCHVGSGLLCAGLHHKSKALLQIYNNFIAFEKRLKEGETSEMHIYTA